MLAIVAVIVAGVVVVACFALLVWRAEHVVAAVLQHQRERDDRRMKLDEAVKAAPPKKEPLPPDLLMIADQYSEPWAREQVRAAIQDQYEDAGDWDAVRNRIHGVV